MTGLKVILEERYHGDELDFAGVAIAISRIPYGRPEDLTPEGVLHDWRGTCSTKHMLFAAIVEGTWPWRRPLLWHRPYIVTQASARDRWGNNVAGVVPPSGLVDVHTFATAEVNDR
jgi:hypothetical protein